MQEKKKKLIKFFTESPLRNRITLFFVVLSVTPLLILGMVSLYVLDIAHKHDVSNLEIQFINQKIEEIEKFFADTLGILELRVTTFQAAPIDPSQQDFLVTGLLESNSAFEEVTLVDVGGSFFIDEATGRSIATGIFIDDRPTVAGEEVAKKSRLAEDPELVDISRLPQFIEPAKGNNYIGDVHYTLSGPVITLAAPVKNKNNDIIHILTAEVNLSRLVRSVELSGLGATGYLILLDKRGYIIADGSPYDIKAGTSLVRFERVRRVLSGEILSGLDGRDIYESFFSSVPVVGAGKRISEINWVLLAEWPLADANAIIINTRNQVLFMTIFSVLAVVILASFFAVRLVKPIRALEEGTRAIEKGKFKNRINIKTGDELEDLGHAFNRMAKGLERLKELEDEFVFIAAHELRAPVTIIKGYISMIMEGSAGKVPPKMNEFLNQTNQANERLAKLVEDLLEVARSDAGRIEINLSSIDIREPIKYTIKELQSLANKKSIILSYNSYENLPNVITNSDRVKEIMVNLIGNAIKYTDDGGKIEISHEIKGKNIVTNIKDNGFGMSVEAQKKLFTKFYRINTDKTKKITGTGLGLFIVKELVKKMKGTISVKSVEGKGSTFSISFPIAN